MKKNIYMILLIVIIIIFGMLILKYVRYYSNNNANKNEEEKDNNIISYKHFQLNIPKDITFKVEDDDTFSLKDNDEKEWEAYITIIYDQNKELLDKPEKYSEYIKANTQYNLSNFEKIQVSGSELYVCKRYRGESDEVAGILGITNYKGNFIYQIDFILLKGEYNHEKITPIINIMNSSNYNSGTEDVYYYEGAAKILEYELE